MVKVVQRGRFRVYVFAERGERHHRAHCHVEWPDGYASVALPDLTVLRGPELPRAARELLDEYMEELRAAWNQPNPGRAIE